MEWVQPIVNGALGGTLAVLITNPLDLAKTRLQLQGELQAAGSYQKHYRGVINCLWRTASEEGPRAVYKGLQSAVCFQILMNGLRFGMYDNFKRWANTHQYAGLGVNIGISSFVGYFSSLVSSPFNMIKTRLMLQSGFISGGSRYHYLGLYDAIRSIRIEKGFIGLYSGAPIMACRTALGSAVQLPAFDLTLKLATQLPCSSNIQTMLASANSTLWLCLITCPIEGITTRYFNQPFVNGKPALYAGAFQALSKIILHEGVLGLYKGLGGLLWRSGPQSFLSLIIVNKLKQIED